MKKAYIIPLVILLLFVSVVPCFADSPTDYQYYVSTPLSQTKNWTSGWHSLNAGTITYGAYLHYNYIANSSPYSYGFYTDKKTLANHNYLVCVVYTSQYSYYLQTPNLYGSQVIFDSGTNVEKSFIVTSNTGNNSLIGFYSGAMQINFTFDIYYYCLFDLTEMYGSDIPSKDVVLQDLVDHGIDPFDVDGDITGYHYIPGFFDPVLDTYSHLFDPFVHISENFSTYSVFFTFAGIILSVLILIFVSVFIIKRFTGGNS